MARKTRARLMLLGGLLWAFFAVNAPCASAGWGQVLTDAELDAIHAQGLFIVDISFGLTNNVGGFSFSSRTTIEFPETPAPNSGVKIDFFDGLFSISAGEASKQPNSNPIPPQVKVSIRPAEGLAHPSHPSNGLPPVTVAFEGGGGVTGKASVLRIRANNIAVDSLANIVVERNFRGVAQGLIRSSLLGSR